MAKITWTTIERPVAELKPADYNPRKLTPAQRKQIEKSLDRFGLADPIIINTDDTIIGGHQRIKILADLGVQTVTVRVPNRQLDANEERELNLRLNKNTGEWDFDLLGNFDEDLLAQVGFNERDLDRIFKDKRPKEDDAPDAPETPKSKRGQVYQLGHHRVMCGDSLNAEDVDKLMDGKRASMIFTDPPYNVDYTGKSAAKLKIENDKMSAGNFRQFLIDAVAAYKRVTEADAPFYLCHATRTQREFEDALNENGYEVASQIVWVKNNATMGFGHYRQKHEPIFYARQKGIAVPFFGMKCKEYTEWTEELTDDELLEKIKANLEREEKGGSSVWRMKKDWNYKHPTQKPIQLVETAILNSTERWGLVLDLFLGSGSTLIAAEKSRRICYGMELDPRYMDVILQRWEEFTEQTAELVAE